MEEKERYILVEEINQHSTDYYLKDNITSIIQSVEYLIL